MLTKVMAEWVALSFGTGGVPGTHLPPDAIPNAVFLVSYHSPNQTYGYYLQLSHDHFLWRSLKLITHYHSIVQRHKL